MAQNLQHDTWIVIPILPGRAEAWRRFVQELQGPRQAEWTAWCGRVGVSQLRVWLQSNQKETMVLLQGQMNASAARLFDDQAPFDRWLQAQLLALHGIDIAQLGAVKKPELVLEIETE